MTTATDSAVYFDPYDIGINADPYPTYARLREEAPAYYNERYDFWALSRHADVEKALVNWQVFSNTRSDILDIIKAGVELPPGVILFEDPPVHTMHRGLMSRVFTPRRMAALEDQVRAFCARSLDPLVGADGFDIIEELASVMPMRVIGMLLGIPEQDQVAVRNKTDANLRTVPGQPMRVKQENVANSDMFADYIEWRAEHPSDDLMTQLLNAEFEDEAGEIRTLDPTGGAHLYGGHRRRRQRDHGPADRLARQAARRAPRSAARGRRGPRADPTGDRRGVALRTDRARDGALRDGGRRVRRHHHPGREPDPSVARLGEPRPSPLHQPGRLRHPSRRHPAPHLRLRAPLLSRRHLARLEGRVAVDELLHRFPEWEIDEDNIKLAPTSTVRGWERMPLMLPKR